jgi:mandelate racemase
LIMPDLLSIGGVTCGMRLARLAEVRAPFSSHLSPDYSADVFATTPTRHWLEYMDWVRTSLPTPARARAQDFTTPRECRAPAWSGTR